MVLPFILAAFFAADMIIMLGTGKDILEHTTGWDPVGDAIDWVFVKLGWDEGEWVEVPDDGSIEIDLSPIMETLHELGAMISDWFLLVLLAIGFVGCLVLLKRR